MHSRQIKVYVAAGSSEVARAVHIIRRLRVMGYTVTYDWTRNVLQRGDPEDDYRTSDRPEEEREGSISGVLRADVLWFLVPYKGSTGGGFETGLAFASGKTIICSGPYLERFFFGEGFIECETDEEVFELLDQMSEAMGSEAPSPTT